MFDRIQKPFLTVDTGEAYQPIRLSYNLQKDNGIEETLNNIKCLQKSPTNNSWTWYWKEECKDIRFESLTSFRKNEENPSRLGTFILHEDKLYLNLSSFKRACLAVPFFHRLLNHSVSISRADFVNKVFALDERLVQGFNELFNEEELERIINQRLTDYEKVKERCETAETAEAAFNILNDYTKDELNKRLPFIERYVFNAMTSIDPDVVFLGFYIFLRGRELVAIKRWFGQAGYTLADATDETINQVFGDLGIDLID